MAEKAAIFYRKTPLFAFVQLEAAWRDEAK